MTGATKYARRSGPASRKLVIAACGTRATATYTGAAVGTCSSSMSPVYRAAGFSEARAFSSRPSCRPCRGGRDRHIRCTRVVMSMRPRPTTQKKTRRTERIGFRLCSACRKLQNLMAPKSTGQHQRVRTCAADHKRRSPARAGHRQPDSTSSGAVSPVVGALQICFTAASLLEGTKLRR